MGMCLYCCPVQSWLHYPWCNYVWVLAICGDLNWEGRETTIMISVVSSVQMLLSELNVWCVPNIISC